MAESNLNNDTTPAVKPAGTDIATIERGASKDLVEQDFTYKNSDPNNPAIPKRLIETIANIIGAPDLNRFWHQFTLEDKGEIISSKYKTPYKRTAILVSPKVDITKVPPKLLKWIDKTEKRREDAHNAAQDSRLQLEECRRAYDTVLQKAARVDDITLDMRMHLARQSNEIKKLMSQLALKDDLINKLAEQNLETMTQNSNLQSLLNEKDTTAEKLFQAAQTQVEQEQDTQKGSENSIEPIDSTKETTTGEQLSNMISWLKAVNVEQGQDTPKESEPSPEPIDSTKEITTGDKLLRMISWLQSVSTEEGRST